MPLKPTKLLASKLLASRTNRDVQSLAVTQLLASTSEWMWFTVALVAAFQIAGTGGVSAVAVAAVLPAVLMSPIVSYLADKIRAQDVLSAALLGRSLVLALAIASSGQCSG